MNYFLVRLHHVIVFVAICFLGFGRVLPKEQKKAVYDLSVVGFVCFADGIGRQTIGLIDCLEKNTDLRINFVNTRSFQFSDLCDVPDDVQKIIKARKKKGISNVAILEDVLTNGNPRGEEFYYTKVPQDSCIKLAYSMFESSDIPENWPTILNNHFDAVVVPDNFLVDVYKNAGVIIPIFVVPLGVYFEEMLKVPLKKEAHYPFTFGFSGAFTDRKNHMMILESFVAEFGNSPHVRLRLHGRGGGDYYDALVNRVRELGVTNVEVMRASYTWQEYFDFMNSLDCYVSFAKGEGFGIPPREAMALGVPVILSDNTAHTTICQSGNVIAVPSEIRMPAYYDHLQKYVGDNYNCTLSDARNALNNVYVNYYAYLQNVSKAREWVQRYSYKNLAALFKTLVKPDEILLGTINYVGDGVLVTNSQTLYEKYLHLLEVVDGDDECVDESLQKVSEAGISLSYNELNPTGEKLSDTDIIGAYRVMCGRPIPEHDFHHFSNFKNTYQWSFSDFAYHLLAMIPVQEHLKIPSLDSVKDFSIVLNNGMTIFGFETDVFIAHSIARYGYWEPQLESLIRKIVNPDDYVLDIGANIGYFTAILAECVGGKGKVYSVEGLPYLCHLLRKAKRFNTWKMVTVCPYVLSNAFGTVNFLVNSVNPGGSCIVSEEEALYHKKIRRQSIVEMPTTTLDELMLNYHAVPRIDFIKMDVEGAEASILQGAQQVLTRFRPKMTLEFSPQRYRDQGIDPVVMLQELANRGYHFETVQNLEKIDDPCTYLRTFSRDPQELVDWISKHNIGYVDLFFMPV